MSFSTIARKNQKPNSERKSDLNCPKCGNKKTEVDPHTDRNRCAKTVIYRTRTCPSCLEVWVTSEETCVCELSGIPIYGVPVVSTASYDSVVFRTRKGSGGTNTTKEEILPEQLERYRKGNKKAPV